MKNLNIVSFALMFLLSISLIVSSGCKTIQKMPDATKLVVTYQSMGVTLEEAKPAILALCASGTLKEADCAKAKKAYNQAVTVFKTLGDAVDSAVITGDDTRVRSLTIQLRTLLLSVNSFLVTQ